MKIKVYDAGEDYSGSDRFTVYFPFSKRMKHNLKPHHLYLDYKGLWICFNVDSLPESDEIKIACSDWLGINDTLLTQGKRVSINKLPKAAKEWLSKREKLWGKVCKLDTEEAWGEFESC